MLECVLVSGEGEEGCLSSGERLILDSAKINLLFLSDFCENEHALRGGEDGVCGKDVVVVEGDETKVLVLGSNKADGTI
jgi:hypothetical protein